ncbi:MAG: hypothetical protein U5L09_09245, partial [Bacteroidales bacterium]|nr:hypothetical protein [Bacteroidales bacterium]
YDNHREAAIFQSQRTHQWEAVGYLPEVTTPNIRRRPLSYPDTKPPVLGSNKKTPNRNIALMGGIKIE